jgi:hypothetical protein
LGELFDGDVRKSKLGSRLAVRRVSVGSGRQAMTIVDSVAVTQSFAEAEMIRRN